MYGGDDVFGLGADAEFATPETKTRRDIELSVATLI